MPHPLLLQQYPVPSCSAPPAGVRRAPGQLLPPSRPRGSGARTPRHALPSSRPQPLPAKQELLSALEGGGAGTRARVLELASLLEDMQEGAPQPEQIDGRWCLVYSTKAGGAEGEGEGEGPVDRVTAALYKIFFRFAPFLAGSQEGKEDQGGGGKKGGVNNEQTVNLKSGKVFNLVSIGTPFGDEPLKITVRGDVEGLPANAPTEAELAVTFTDWSIGPLSLPLPRPRGSLTVTYCDEDLRISRGGRGGIFITTRL